MPIIGVGTDIVEVERVKEVFERERSFGRRVFTDAELEYALPKENRYQHLAARFAAKEAVAKALGRSFSWHEVEITNDYSGKPVAYLHGRAKGISKGIRVHVSISHTKGYACAVAIVEEEEVAE